MNWPVLVLVQMQMQMQMQVTASATVPVPVPVPVTVPVPVIADITVVTANYRLQVKILDFGPVRIQEPELEVVSEQTKMDLFVSTDYPLDLYRYL